MRGFQLWLVELHSLRVFVSCYLECHLVVVVACHHWLKLGVGQNLHHLVEVIVVVCLSDGQFGFHPRNFFCTESLEKVETVMVKAVQGGLHAGGLGIVLFPWCRWA